ncbi:MAG: methyltransferase domain-containing protein [Bacteroidales bacterium]|nr:methyltransferase domain-containing protein [Bacteroidales bacterium]
MEEFLSKEYWNRQYQNHQTGWDMGYASPALMTYFEQKSDKSAQILVPGAGNGWEVEYLYKNGWKNTYLLDFATNAVESFKIRFPEFPEKNIIVNDFFGFKGQYDYIVEQAFFSSIPRNFRTKYAQHIFELLKSGGKLVALLFNHEFNFSGPPFGGTVEEYNNLFSKLFNVKHFTIANNSIKPRKGRELFIILEKPSDS